MSDEPMERLQRELNQAQAQLEKWTQFQPTVEQINALPDPLRRYIMELETHCDPAGDLRDKILAQTLCRQLEKQYVALMAQCRRFALYMTDQEDQTRDDHADAVAWLQDNPE